MKISVERLNEELKKQGLTSDQILNFLAIVRGESGYVFEAQNPEGNDNSWGLSKSISLKLPMAWDGLRRWGYLSKPTVYLR